MEIVGPPREKSRIAKILRKLSEGFSVPEEPTKQREPRPHMDEQDRLIVVSFDRSASSFREHCGVVVAVSGICPICSTRLGPRDEP